MQLLFIFPEDDDGGVGAPEGGGLFDGRLIEGLFGVGAEVKVGERREGVLLYSRELGRRKREKEEVEEERRWVRQRVQSMVARLWGCFLSG